ncbi:MAG: MFS transporter [Lachnospiraceae bacterium]|nr:MFS transporter [Lachnospiraceae bacterium]
MKWTYQTTIKACFIGYIVQAIVNNFAPLLFVTFQNTYQISLSKIALLITVNFGVQLATDFAATLFVDKIGYKISVVAAHGFSALGFVLLTVLPEVMDPFYGILISLSICAVGGGLIEVLISPIMESCPTENKETAMSLLHSFYCWGHVGVVLLTTIFFYGWGISYWKVLTLLWTIIPLGNGFLFTKVPIAPLVTEDVSELTIMELFQHKAFWIFLLLMICAGASEQSVSQWASVFAERGLGISKTMGDLAGPMAFAIMMGSARAIYGKYGHRLHLTRFMKISTFLCIGSYLIMVFVPLPVVSLMGCAISGFSVGIMWPGTFSTASSVIKQGKTAMFAMMALAGDLGCSIGPAVVGALAEAMDNRIQFGILGAILFPVLFLFFLRKMERRMAASE